MQSYIQFEVNIDLIFSTWDPTSSHQPDEGEPMRMQGNYACNVGSGLGKEKLIR